MQEDYPVINARITNVFNEEDDARIEVTVRGKVAGTLSVQRNDMYTVLEAIKGWIPVEDDDTPIVCITGTTIRRVVTNYSILCIEDVIEDELDECMVVELPRHIRLCISPSLQDNPSE